MNALSKDELKNLIKNQKGFCVSLFMPTHRSGAETQQNQIRLKNLLREAEEKLVAGGMRPQEAKALLEQAQGLSGNIPFWRKQSDGLALFLSPEMFGFYCLPATFEKLVVVSNRFHLKPLLPLLGVEKRFYILALSQNNLRFIEGTAQGAREIDLETIPRNLDEALRYDEPEKQIRFHTGKSGNGKRTTMTSGHGSTRDDAKENIFKYFRLIDKGLRNLLRDERAPLVLAGVDYLFPIYREANTYANLMNEGIPGNPEGMSTEQLHKQALALVTPSFRNTENDALSLYRQSSGTGLTSNDIGEIVPAAYHGRVGMLFFATGYQEWGAIDSEGNIARRGKGEKSSEEDLLDFAAIHTFLNGGTVFPLAQEKIPDNTPLAAVFRY
ncbi:MAG: hypothetical protein HY742_06490 [Deltaproteobacteria bacterium]|nr:hypothetical protein [Deltaproteobacteria bacterium]